jgi:hypothetical protein
MLESLFIQIVEPRLTRHVICLHCGVRQLLFKHKSWEGAERANDWIVATAPLIRCYVNTKV